MTLRDTLSIPKDTTLPDGKIATWMTTGANPKRDYGPDQGQMGWRLHAVVVTKEQLAGKLHDIRHARAMCGIQPAHGWGMDLFIDEPCKRCTAKLAKVNPEAVEHYVRHIELVKAFTSARRTT